MHNRIVVRYALKIKYLASTQYSGKNFVLFCCRKNKNRVRRRLFQCFQKCIKCAGTQHVNLIDNIHLIFSCLWRKTYLLYQCTDIIDRIITGRIELVNIERSAVIPGGRAAASPESILPDRGYGLRARRKSAVPE